MRIQLSALPVLAFVCTGMALPQGRPAQQTSNHAAPAQQDPILVRDAGPLPKVEDLKFPPLPKVRIPQPEIFTLSNGMKVYLLEDHELPLVRGQALIRTGNLFDPKEKRGLAELTGTVLRSGGTQQLTGDQLDEKLENMAASVESGIGESSGSAGFSCLKENTATVLQLFHDVLVTPAFRQEKLDLAKTQIKSAISRRNDEANSIASREFYRMVYGRDTPYGGEEEYDTIDAVSRKDIVDFYQRYFFPKNIALSIYGDFDSKQMRAELESVFGTWTVTQPSVPPFPPVDAPPMPGVFLVSKRDVTQTFFEIGHLGGELKDKDFAALSVASDVFGGGFSSRLFREVRTRLGYAYSIGADWAANYDHPGVFRISGSTKTQSTTATIEAVLKQLNGVRTQEITDNELKVAKESVLNSLVFAFERPSSTLARLMTYDYYQYPADFLTQYQQAVAAVTKQDVLRVAKQYFDPAKLTIIAVGNEDGFGQPLSALNLPVKPLDVSIPPAHEQAAKADPQSLARGKALLQKAIQYVGGEAQLTNLHDYSETASKELTTPRGKLAIQTNLQMLTNGTVRQEQKQAGGAVVVYFDNKAGWANTPEGVQEIPDSALQHMRQQSSRQLITFLAYLAKTNANAVYDGPGSIQVNTPAGQLVVLKIDEATGAPLSVNYTDGGSKMVEHFSDWRQIGALKAPFKQETERDGKTYLVSAASDVKMNSNLTEEDLKKRQ